MFFFCYNLRVGSIKPAGWCVVALFAIPIAIGIVIQNKIILKQTNGVRLFIPNISGQAENERIHKVYYKPWHPEGSGLKNLYS